MENKLHIQINKIVNKVKAIENKKVRRNKQMNQLKRDIERLKDKTQKYYERYNFYMNLINLKSDEEREKAMELRKKQRRQQNNE